jgi:hypothetical protein
MKFVWNYPGNLPVQNSLNRLTTVGFLGSPERLQAFFPLSATGGSNLSGKLAGKIPKLHNYDTCHFNSGWKPQSGKATLVVPQFAT